MRFARKTIIGAALFAMGATIAPQVALAEPTIASERAAHPRLVVAIRQLQAALRELQAAPDDFGGNKGAAMEDTRRALHSLKKALYFRLHMDDEAIDRAQ